MHETTPQIITLALSNYNPSYPVQEMAAVCKPDGQLLLLEHGRASSKWVNSKLDGEAEKHLAKFGCYWNRPILDIVAEVRSPSYYVPALLELDERVEFGC